MILAAQLGISAISRPSSIGSAPAGSRVDDWRGYRALLEAARKSKVGEKKNRGSLKRIAATKALAQPPTPLDMDKYKGLAAEITKMNETLDYRYPGESHVS